MMVYSMKNFSDILYEVWRQASQSIEIEESCARIVGILGPQIPFEQCILFGVDQKKSVLEVLAYGFPSKNRFSLDSHIHLSDKDLFALLGWRGKPTLLCKSKREPRGDDLFKLFPVDQDRDVVAGILNYQNIYMGLVLFISSKHTVFQPSHLNIIEHLLEPFSVALGNDHLLREMNVLREAAERDKEALLHRLGRKELGDTIIGSNTTLRAVMERVDMIARSDLPILILGEKGTGKEVIARDIHRRSLRSSGPFIRVNCGAVPAQLLDSYLFGYQKGTFTGSVDSQKGWFERADGGTLFIDEISELNLSVQERFLRVLEEGWIERIGSNKPIKVDVRIIAAAQRDLTDLVKKGDYQEELWSRITVFPVQMPPLRERLEDIPELVKYFAERSAVRFNLPLQLPDEKDYDLLTSYNWPGNIRELATVIDRAALLGNGKTLELCKTLGNIQASATLFASKDNVNDFDQEKEILTLDEVMRNHIEQTLRFTEGRIEGPSGAAKLLAINPHTLRARMRKLGICWKNFRKKNGNGKSGLDYMI